MKIICLIEKIHTAVAQLEKLAAKQASLPVLAGILITTEKNNLVLRATNLHVGAEIIIPAQIEQEGTMVVDAQVFQRTLTSLTRDKKIEITQEEGNMRLQTESAKLLIKAYDPTDFPTLPRDIEGNVFSLPVEKFIEGITAVYYSASQSDIKPEISSIYMYSDEYDVVFVATDSFRLAEKKITLKEKAEIDGVLIPVKNIIEIVRLLQNYKESLGILIGENQISFTTDTLYCTSRLVEGSFPDYRQIIPKTKETTVTALVEDVKQALRTLSIFSDKYHQVDIEVKHDTKECIMSSAHSDIGSSVLGIPAKIQGDSASARVNYTYITDAFQSLQKDSMEINFHGLQKPLTLTSTKNSSFLYLIMPMNR